jgi:hypothetical protein
MTANRDSLYRHERSKTVTLSEAKGLLLLHVYFIMSFTIVYGMPMKSRSLILAAIFRLLIILPPQWMSIF